jgi:hypothetical protein
MKRTMNIKPYPTDGLLPLYGAKEGYDVIKVVEIVRAPGVGVVVCGVGGRCVWRLSRRDLLSRN